MSKGALRGLNQYLPPQMRLSPTNITSVGIWGGTAAVGALWLVQPFSYLRSLMGGSPTEDEKDQASGGQESTPVPALEVKADKEDEDDSSSGGVDEGGKQEGGKDEGGDKKESDDE